MASNIQPGHSIIHHLNDLPYSSKELSRNKHRRSSEGKKDIKRNAKSKEDPEINAITTSNRFVLLDTPDGYTWKLTITEGIPISSNPPWWRHSIQIMTKTLISVASTDEFKLKVNNNQVKIISSNPDSYRKIIKFLKMLNANFHTVSIKTGQTFLCNSTQLTSLSTPRSIKGRT